MTEESRAEKFLELFNKGKEFTEELLRENQRLRYRLASLETDQATASSDELQRLRAAGRGCARRSGQDRRELLRQPGHRRRKGDPGEAAGRGAAQDQRARHRTDRYLPIAAAEGLVLGGRLRALLAPGRARRDGHFLFETLFAVGAEAEHHPELPRSADHDINVRVRRG